MFIKLSDSTRPSTSLLRAPAVFVNLCAILLLTTLFIAPSTRAMAQLTVSAANATVIAGTDGTPVTDALTITRGPNDQGTVTFGHVNTPAGVTVTFSQPGTGNTGSVSYSASSSAVAGTYSIWVHATDNAVATVPLTLVIAPYVLTVKNATDFSSGLDGQMAQFMSSNTSPGPAGYYWQTFPSAGLTEFNDLNMHHIRVMPYNSISATQTKALQVSQPWNYDTGAASDWDFSAFDAVMPIMEKVGDQSPMFNTFTFPPFCATADNGCFATYVGNIVSAMNFGSFQYNWNGNSVQVTNPTPTHFTWWEIINEPNNIQVSSTLGGSGPLMTASQYATFYNVAATQMLKVDPTIKIVGPDIADFGVFPTDTNHGSVPTKGAKTDPSPASTFIPGLVLNPSPSAVSFHIYGTGLVTTTLDASLFNGLTIQFIPDMQTFKNQFPNIPIWVTEFNANSAGDEPRNYNAFTTAYRPLGFALLAKAGSQGFYPFAFESNEFGDLTSANVKTYGFQTDYVLSHAFPSTSPNPTILQTVDSEPSNPSAGVFPTVNIFSTLNADKSVTVMITNYAVANPTTDVNQAGASRTVYLNVTALGTFSSGTEVDLNTNSMPQSGTPVDPVATAISSSTLSSINSGTFELTMPGYGTSVLTLKP